MEGIINSKSKTFLVFCFCFLFGVALISILEFRLDFVYLYVSLFVLLSLIITSWKNKKTRLIFISLLCFVLGIGRYMLAFPIAKNHISNFNNQKVELVGYVAAEPDVRMDGVRYVVRSSEFGVQRDSVKGRVYLKSSLYPRFSYGDRLELNCKLREPEPVEDFRYDMYLARYHTFSICDASYIKKVGSGEGNPIMHGIFSLKETVAKRINLLWHEPYASFMAGLLYGYRGGLGSLNDLFSITGVTHIVAISGYNITIIATILITFCVQLLIPRKKAFWLVSTGIVLFVLFAGASASVVRAGIMGIIVLLAKQMGRTSSVGNVMILTAVVMTLQNPFVLIWDAGFQLSFISTLGLVYLVSLIEPWFKKVPDLFGMKESVVTTLAAITATLPLILYQFGRLSIVAVFVNVLILWILPFIMIAGFFATVFSFLWLPIGQVISWIAFLGMQYIVIIVKWFAGLPFASIDFSVPVWGMILMYLLLILWIRNGTRITRI